MANRTTKSFNLVQGTGRGANVIPVTVKTTTKAYFDRLINDYRRLGKLDSRAVDIVPVVPQFGTI